MSCSVDIEISIWVDWSHIFCFLTLKSSFKPGTESKCPVLSNFKSINRALVPVLLTLVAILVPAGRAAYFAFCQATPWDGLTRALWISPTGRTAPLRTSPPWTRVGFCTATLASGRRSAVWMKWRMEWSARPSRVWRLGLITLSYQIAFRWWSGIKLSLDCFCLSEAEKVKPSKWTFKPQPLNIHRVVGLWP